MHDHIEELTDRPPVAGPGMARPERRRTMIVLLLGALIGGGGLTAGWLVKREKIHELEEDVKAKSAQLEAAEAAAATEVQNTAQLEDAKAQLLQELSEAKEAKEQGDRSAASRIKGLEDRLRGLNNAIASANARVAKLEDEKRILTEALVQAGVTIDKQVAINVHSTAELRHQMVEALRNEAKVQVCAEYNRSGKQGRCMDAIDQGIFVHQDLLDQCMSKDGSLTYAKPLLIHTSDAAPPEHGWWVADGPDRGLAKGWWASWCDPKLVEWAG